MVLPTKESDFNMNGVSMIKPTELKYNPHIPREYTGGETLRSNLYKLNRFNKILVHEVRYEHT